MPLLVAIPMLGAWPTAAYLSARKIRGKSGSEATRFALATGAIFLFVGIIASDLVFPLREGRPYIDYVFPMIWVGAPFFLIGLELAVRGKRPKPGP